MYVAVVRIYSEDNQKKSKKIIFWQVFAKNAKNQVIMTEKEPPYRPVYTCTLNNRQLWAERVVESNDGIQIDIPILIGKYHKNGGRDLAIQALKIPGAKVSLTIDAHNSKVTVELPSQYIQRKLVKDKNSYRESGGQEQTRYATFYDFKVDTLGYAYVFSVHLFMKNTDDKILFEAKVLYCDPDFATKKPSEENKFSIQVFQTFSVNNKRSRNWVSLVPNMNFVIDKDTVKEGILMGKEDMPYMRELSFSGELV